MQGWDPIVIKEIFDSALKKLFQSNQVPNPTATGPVPSLMPQQHLFMLPSDKDILQQMQKYLQAEIHIKQFTLAYSRPKTIRNIIAKAKMFEVNGREVSKFVTGELN